MTWITALLVLGHTTFNTLAHFCFKLSVGAEGVWLFIFWQALGNLAAFTGVISYTFALRRLPLHLAFPLIQGLSVLVVSFLVGGWLFGESITPRKIAGLALVAVGILLIARFVSRADSDVQLS